MAEPVRLFAGLPDLLSVGATVNASAAVQTILLTWAAVEDILSFTAIEGVISAETAKDVITIRPIEFIVAFVSTQNVVTIRSLEELIVGVDM